MAREYQPLFNPLDESYMTVSIEAGQELHAILEPFFKKYGEPPYNIPIRQLAHYVVGEALLMESAIILRRRAQERRIVRERIEQELAEKRGDNASA